MNRTVIVAVVAALAVTVSTGRASAAGEQAASPTGTASAAIAQSVPSSTTKLPRLVDLGADKCIPCKMMSPILEALKKEYTARMEVEFIDVWKNPDAAKKYNIKLIPTQIFYDASGKERFRHEGFLAKDDILAKWKELGVRLNDGK